VWLTEITWKKENVPWSERGSSPLVKSSKSEGSTREGAECQEAVVQSSGAAFWQSSVLHGFKVMDALTI
jgi:hypothetical protein